MSPKGIIKTDKNKTDADKLVDAALNEYNNGKLVLGVTQERILVDKNGKPILDNGKEQGDNKTKYGEWYKVNGVPWCAEFVSYCADEAGILGIVVPKYKSVALGLQQYKNEDEFESRKSGYAPNAGDVIFFNSKGQNHTGIVVGVDSKTNKIYTIEGNSGDKVAAHYYKLDDKKIVGYGVNGGNGSGVIIPKATHGSRYSTR